MLKAIKIKWRNTHSNEHPPPTKALRLRLPSLINVWEEAGAGIPSFGMLAYFFKFPDTVTTRQLQFVLNQVSGPHARITFV